MMDTLQVLTWSLTYLLMVIGCIQSRNTEKVSMPVAALVLNFAWEACALQLSSGFWGHILWFFLDMILVCHTFFYLKHGLRQAIYIFSVYGFVAVLFLLFTLPGGKLLSCFAIDLIMAVTFLTDRKKLSSRWKRTLAVTRLLGDAFAGLFYGPQSAAVAVMAVMVLICNITYTILCFREVSRKQSSVQTSLT